MERKRCGFILKVRRWCLFAYAWFNIGGCSFSFEVSSASLINLGFICNVELEGAVLGISLPLVTLCINGARVA